MLLASTPAPARGAAEPVVSGCSRSVAAWPAAQAFGSHGCVVGNALINGGVAVQPVLRTLCQNDVLCQLVAQHSLTQWVLTAGIQRVFPYLGDVWTMLDCALVLTKFLFFGIVVHALRVLECPGRG